MYIKEVALKIAPSVGEMATSSIFHQIQLNIPEEFTLSW
jgi:hypothetical protein